MSQDKLKLIVDGEEKTYDIYFSFSSKELNKGYIGYSDHSLDEDGNEILMVSYYDPSVGPTQLFEITDEKEWTLVDEVIEKITKLANGGK